MSPSTLYIFKRCRLLRLKILSSVGDREISLYVIVHTFMHCLPPITVSCEKRLRVSLSRGVDLIYNKLQNLISQKLKKLLEQKF